MSEEFKPVKKYPYEPVLFWHDIAQYIQVKYCKNVRDWAGRSTGKKLDMSLEYQDFWHHIIDENMELENGSMFYLTYYPSEDIPVWQKEIYEILVKEGFLEGDDSDEEPCYMGTFWAEW